MLVFLLKMCFIDGIIMIEVCYMIKEIIKEIKAIIRPTHKNAGFKVKNSHYVRMTSEEILQCFSFQTLSDGTMFTVNFGIMPLYEVGCKWFTEPMRLGQIIGEGDKWWNDSEKSVKEVSSLILNTLIPLFDQCSTYKDYYNAVEAHIISVDEDVSHAKGLALYCSWLPEMFCRLCLRTGHNDKAMICIHNTIRRIERSKIDVDSLNDEMNDYKKQYANECESRISEQKKLEIKVLSNDISDILEEFDNIEKENYSIMAKYSC